MIKSEVYEHDILAESIWCLDVFPFDAFRFNCLCLFASEKQCESVNEIRLRVPERCALTPIMLSPNHPDSPIGLAAGPRSGEFSIESVVYGIGCHTSPMTGETYEDFVFSIVCARDPTWYLYKCVFPLCGIVMGAACTYFVEVAALGDRLSVIAAMFLTCFAVQWTIMNRVPRVPYLTSLDKIIYFTMLALACMAVGSGVAHRLDAREGSREAARVVDWVGLALGVVAFAAPTLRLVQARRRRRARWAEGGDWWHAILRPQELYELRPEANARHRGALKLLATRGRPWTQAEMREW